MGTPARPPRVGEVLVALLPPAMLLLAATLLFVLLLARLERPCRRALDPHEAHLLALGEEEDWRARNAVRRRYAPAPPALGFRFGRSA